MEGDHKRARKYLITSHDLDVPIRINASRCTPPTPNVQQLSPAAMLSEEGTARARNESVTTLSRKKSRIACALRYQCRNQV
jgi:hypothetical protein